MTSCSREDEFTVVLAGTVGARVEELERTYQVKL
jgi:hypothetical protein